MIPTLSAAVVAVFLAGLISLVGYILLERRQTGTATEQGDVVTSSPSTKPNSRSPSPIPSTQASAATRQGDVATSSPNAKSTSRSPSPIPSTQASDSSQGTGATGSNHGVDDSNKPTADASGQVKRADSPQGTGAIETINGVDGSNEATVDASDQVKSAAATRQGDVATSSKNAKPTSRSPSKIPSTKASASTRKEDIATSSPKSKPTSPSPSPIPSTQASGVHAPMDASRPQHSQMPDQQPCLDDKTLQDVASVLGCDWTKLALVLGFKSVQVQTIERNYQSDITRQGLEMLVTWKQAQSTSVEQQWYRLCTALEKIGRADVARFQNGIGCSSGNIGTVSGSHYSSPSDAAAATGQGDVATSSTNAKQTCPSPSPSPPTQASDSPQGTGAIETINRVDDSNKTTVDGSGQVKSAAATGQGDVLTSSSIAKSTSRSPSTIPSTQASDSPEGAGATETNQRVDGSKKPTVDASDKVKSAGIIAATGKGDDATSSSNVQTTSPSPSPIFTQVSGVHAPGPQHSQRPDQEPWQRAPSHQEAAGNKTRDILKGVYTTTGSYVQLLPGVDNGLMHIPGIYTKVQLETREGVAFVIGQKGETVNSTEYNKIFRLRTKTDELIKRLVFFGMGGVGKSTIFDTIAYHWAEGENEFLKRFKLVFLLKMCALSQESDLLDSIFDQLLGEDSGIAKDELDKFILANANEVLILLDGFDEMRTKKLNTFFFGSILKALNRKVYKECLICISTRPSHLETLMSKSLVQNPCTCVEVLGYTDEDVPEYVWKFYDYDPDSGRALIQTIGKSNTLRGFAKIPMLLLLMCLLWRERKQLPETTSLLFTEAVDYLFTRQGICSEDASKTVIAIGQTALHGLMSANQVFSFQKDEFEQNALDLALKAGILNQHRVIKNQKCHISIQFMHKKIQEYCAMKYLQSKSGDLSKEAILKRISGGARL